jgi:YfiH family protein
MSVSLPTTELRPLQSALLATLPGIAHAVTYRVPGLGRAEGNIGYSAPRDRADAWAMRQAWSAAAGLQATRLVTLGQVHGAEVQRVLARHAGWGARPGSRQVGLGDALVTNEAGPVLLTLHADCQPILFVDPARNGRGAAIAVAHAGWRGTVANIVGEVVDVMRAAFGTRADDLHVFLGPAIGGCCYAVGEEVASAWRARACADAGAALVATEQGASLSLAAANRLLLERAGVSPEHIDGNAICTRCQAERWFSHRAQGPETGRFGAMIALAPSALR